jgi:hypothetical protein
MKRLLLAAALIFAMSPVSHAQDQATAASPEQNFAAGLANTSMAGYSSSQQGSWLIAGSQPLGASAINFADFRSAALAQPADLASASAAVNWSPASAATPPSAADPGPSQHGSTYSDEPYRFEISVGVAVVRFRSSIYSATAIGLNTSVAYYWKDWLAVEGNVVPAFAPTIYQNEHVKYLGYAGGAKVVFSHSGLVPWVHGLVGGAHILPQTGLGGKSAFQIQTGGGADYALNPRISARVGADYVFTHFFGESQNNFQAYAGFVYHF